MKRILLLLLLAASPMAAQTDAGATRPLQSAWFGSVGGGLAAHDNGAFSDRLKSYTPFAPDGGEYLYQTEDFSYAGFTLDAGGGILLGGDYILGASGQRVTYPVVRSINAPGNPRDEYSLSGGGGGLDVGYVVFNDAGGMIFPYLHLGYYGYALDYTNNQGDSIPFFEGKPVAPGTTATYTGAAPRFAIGVGLVKLVGVGGTAGGGSGLAITARLTWGMMISRPEWMEPDGSVVNNGGLAPGYNGVALSIQIGGGGGE